MKHPWTCGIRNTLHWPTLLVALLSLLCLLCSTASASPRAIVGHSYGLSVLDLGTQPPKVVGPVLEAFTAYGLVVTPDKKYLLGADFYGYTLHRVDISDPDHPAPAGTLTLPVNPEDIALSPDGKLAVTTDGGGTSPIAFVDVVNLKLNGVYRLQTPNASAQAVAIASDNRTVIFADWYGRRLISGVLKDDGSGLDGENVQPLSFEPLNVAVSPDGKTVLAIGYYSPVQAFEVVSPGVLRPTATVGVPSQGQSIAFSPDGKKAITYHDGYPSKLAVLRVDSPSTIAVDRIIDIPVSPYAYFGVNTIAVSPDGKYAVASDAGRHTSGLAAIIDLDTMAVSTVNVGPSMGVAFIPQIPPTISGTPLLTGLVGSGYSFAPTAANATRFSIANPPAWASFNESTGVLSGIPNAAGTYADIVITATSEDGSASLPAFTITVTDPNRAPVIGGTPAPTAFVGERYRFTPAAGDSDGDTLTFGINNRPPWAAFDPETGTLSGIPAASDFGIYSGISIYVSDGKLTAELPSFSISVPNRTPSISGAPAAGVVAGAAYTFTPTAGDADGDSLTFAIVNKPVWASFNTSTGTLSGAPSALQAATYSDITISVSDGRSTTMLPPFAIKVIVGCGAPSIVTVPTTNATGTFTVSWSSSNVAGVTYVLEQSFNGGDFAAVYSGTSTAASVTVKQNGSYTYRVKATKTGYADSAYKYGAGGCAVTLACGAPATLIVPSNNATGVFTVSWTTSNVAGVTYVLEQSYNGGDFVAIYSGTSAIASVTVKQNGSYAYRVKATKTDYADSAYKTGGSCGVTLACGMPATLLVPSTSTTGSFTVSWTSSNVTGVTYVLEQSFNGGSYAEVYRGKVQPAGITVTADGRYTYRVKAVKDEYIDSDYKYGNNACVVTR